ncbi:MAG: MFS transporter [Candidatus Hermodarchaeota archaeon]
MEDNISKKSYRHFFYFLLGQEFSVLGSSIVYFVISWWITVETNNPIYLSFSSVLYILPQIIIAPIAGVLSDRLNRKYIIISIDAAQAIVTFGLFLVFFLKIANIWLVLSVNTLRSMLQAFHVPTFYSIVPSMVPKERLNRVNGINTLFTSLIYMVGPILGGSLYEILPIELIFMIDIITFVIALIPLLFITIPSVKTTKTAEHKTSFYEDFITGLRTVKAVPGLLSLILLAMLINFIMRPFSDLMPYYIKNVHNGTPLNLAFVTVSIPVANITGSIINTIKKNWKHKVFLIMFGTIMIFIGYSFLIFTPTGFFILLGIGLFIQGIAMNFILNNYMTILQSCVPSDKVGRIISLDHSLSFVIMPIGSLIGGPLALLIGITNLYLLCVISGISISSLIWIFSDIHKLHYVEKDEIQINDQLK